MKIHQIKAALVMLNACSQFVSLIKKFLSYLTALFNSFTSPASALHECVFRTSHPLFPNSTVTVFLINFTRCKYSVNLNNHHF